MFLGVRPQDAALGFGGDTQTFENRGFHFGAEAFEFLHLVRLAGGAQVVERGDVQLVVELRGPFGPQTGHAKDGQNALGHFRQQLVEHRQRAGLQERDDLLRQVLADAFDRGERSIRVGHDIGHRLRLIVNRPRRVAVSAHAKRIRVLKLEQISDLLEDSGNFVIGHGKGIRDQGSEVRGAG